MRQILEMFDKQINILTKTYLLIYYRYTVKFREASAVESKEYIVSKIEGEYAYLRRIDAECDEDLFIAMALLPAGIDIGTKLHYECMEYTVI